MQVKLLYSVFQNSNGMCVAFYSRTTLFMCELHLFITVYIMFVCMCTCVYIFLMKVSTN